MRPAILIGACLVILAAAAHPLFIGAKVAVPDRVVSIPATAVPRKAGGVVPAAPEFEEIRGREGFWRVGRTADGVWWFISPTGEAEFLNTVTTVVPYQHGRDEDGPHYVSRDWAGNISDEGNLEDWARATLRRIRSQGFKGLGAWCHPVFHKLDVPISRDLNIWTWVPAAHRRFYSPEWAVAAEEAIARQTAPLRENRNLVGYFLDNELDWGESAAGPAHYFDGLAPDDPNRVQVLATIREIWPDISAFNADWRTQLGSYDELAGAATLPQNRGDAYSRLFEVWLEKLARDYFTLTCGLVRKYDPNHLILGVRFKGYAPREVVAASRGITDAQSLNYYVSDARLDYDMFRWINELSDQPLMITEYSFHALDGRSGNRNTVGFAAQVLDQQARADAYRLFTTRLARVPFIIGADWFQWNDEPPSGRRVDGEDVNFGIVDIDDREYESLAAAVRETTPLLNELHQGSATDDRTDVWRESFAIKPTVNIPYVARPPRLNGELSDWTPASRVQGVRHSQTVGLERSPLPMPNLHMAWNESGLYLGIEVFDNDIHSAPARGWWWTRDCVEFWISTKPVEADQERYDPYCHQFFFVPVEFPGPDGVAGVVGQWHRPGDNLNDHLIPHPDIKDAVRVLPDRYVVEIFIPASALNGFDPHRTGQIAMNFHVKNFQHAIDYYWSAPKEAMTQLRPNTWGLANLLRPDGHGQ